MNSLLKDLSAKIGNTELVTYKGYVPNGNRIIFKLECENPFGSHYDRVYLDLYRHFENQGLLTPGCEVLETTSGTAGVSFAAIGKILGYKCIVAIPEGGEKARENAIANEGAELIYTPGKDYIAGFPKFVKRFLVERRKSGKPITFFNHSMGSSGKENIITTSALATIGTEVLEQVINPDYLLVAVGNGSSILGPGRVVKGRMKLLTYETFQSAVGYDIMYPGKYEAYFAIKPGSLSRHSLPGTSYQGIVFPHIKISFDEGLVDEAFIVSDEKTDSEYFTSTGRNLTCLLPHWDEQDIPFGRTTRAGLAIALDKANHVKNKTFVVLAYDKPDRYDS